MKSWKRGLVGLLGGLTILGTSMVGYAQDSTPITSYFNRIVTGNSREDKLVLSGLLREPLESIVEELSCYDENKRGIIIDDIYMVDRDYGAIIDEALAQRNGSDPITYDEAKENKDLRRFYLANVFWELRDNYPFLNYVGYRDKLSKDGIPAIAKYYPYENKVLFSDVAFKHSEHVFNLYLKHELRHHYQDVWDKDELSKVWYVEGSKLDRDNYLDRYVFSYFAELDACLVEFNLVDSNPSLYPDDMRVDTMKYYKKNMRLAIESIEKIREGGFYISPQKKENWKQIMGELGVMRPDLVIEYNQRLDNYTGGIAFGFGS